MGGDTSLGNQALFSDEGGMQSFGNGVCTAAGFANICMIETERRRRHLRRSDCPSDGWRIVQELRAVTDLPVRYMIYGHGHADHAFGARAVLEDAAERGHPKPVIVAHENLPARFDRYQRMLPYHEHINRIQFAIPEGIPAFPWDYIYPDETFREETSFQLGETTFELRHARGETDDHVWMWIPEREVGVRIGLLGVVLSQRREPLQGAALRPGMGAGPGGRRALSPQLMLPGHGAAISGNGEIEDACLTVAGALSAPSTNRWWRCSTRGSGRKRSWSPSPGPRSSPRAPTWRPSTAIPTSSCRRCCASTTAGTTAIPPTSFRPREPSSRGRGAGAGGRRRYGHGEGAANWRKKGKTQLALHLVDLVLDAGGAARREALELKSLPPGGPGRPRRRASSPGTYSWEECAGSKRN